MSSHTASGAVLYHQELAHIHLTFLSLPRMRDAAMVVATAVTATVISNQPPAIVTVVTVVTATVISHPPS